MSAAPPRAPACEEDGDLVEVLPWDSEFFGVRVARIRPGRLGAEALAAALAFCGRQAVDVVTFLADPGDAATIRRVEDARFRLVDIRMTLDRSLRAGAPPPPAGEGEPAVRAGRREDLPALRAIARVAHGDSRFAQDPRFAPRAGDLFVRWIERSFEGFADAVLVVDAPGERGAPEASGYVTCRHDAATGEGWIGLVGVAEETRGRGAGSALLGAALRWFSERGSRTALVATQARNVAAFRLYERAGFRVRSVGLWYHLWRTRAA